MPRFRLAMAAALAMLAVAPAVASANATVSQLGGVVTVASTTANEDNRITISLDGTLLRIEERGAEPQGLDNSSVVICQRGETPKVVVCDSSKDPRGLTSIVVRLGLGDDILDPLALDVPVNATGESGDDDIAGGGGVDELDGGPDDDIVRGGGGNDTELFGGEGSGSDRVFGEAGDDQINGGEGSDPELDGGAGRDTVSGAPGNDVLLGGPGNDRLDGAAGADAVSYQQATGTVNVVLGPGGAETAGNGTPATGEAPAENDTILNVENATGGKGADRLTGNELGNGLDGREGPDTLDGAGGDDGLRGGDGVDTLLGGPGADTLDGVAGNDTLDGGEGADAYLGGPGDDTIVSRDGVPEPRVDCQEGAADDLVGDNGADGAANCEAVAPQTVSPPSLAGDPVEGATLSVNGFAVSGGPFARNVREWHRCLADGTKCGRVITAESYRVTQPDVGKILFARAVVSNSAGRVQEDTARTPPIADVPGTPGTVTPKPPEQVIPRGPAAEIAGAGAAALTAAGKKKLRLATGRRIACRAAVRSCSAQVTVTTKVKVKPKKRKKGKRARKRTKTVELGYARYIIKAGQATDVDITLKKSARKRLKAGRKVTLSLKIEVIQAGADDVVQKVKLKLRVPRKKR